MRTDQFFPFTSAALLIAGGLCFTACTKDDAAEPAPAAETPAPTPAPNTTPTFNGAHAVLAAVSTASTQEVPILGTIQVELNTAVASFADDAGVLVSAGAVTCNGNALSEHSGSYVFTPGPTNITGIDFNSGVEWTVAGGNGIPGFTRNASAIAFPTAGQVTSAITVDRSANYTLAVANMSNADSVYFFIGDVLLRRGANTSSCTFSAAELGSLNAGSSLAMVVGFNYYNEAIGGKDVYFVKERVITQSVTLQ